MLNRSDERDARERSLVEWDFVRSIAEADVIGVLDDFQPLGLRRLIGVFGEVTR